MSDQQFLSLLNEIHTEYKRCIRDLDSVMTQQIIGDFE